MNNLIGTKILEVNNHDNDIVTIITDKGTMEFYHQQDCCESVYLEDGFEELEDMVGEVILNAYESTKDDEECCELGMWTFYNISSHNKDACLRFYGTSNGYYSVGVDTKFTPNEK